MDGFNIDEDLKELICDYNLDGELYEYYKIDSGHINDTYYVKTKSPEGNYSEYVFQRINDYVFKQPEKVMSNILKVSRYLSEKYGEGSPEASQIVSFLCDKNGQNYTLAGKNGFWRISRYVDSITYEIPNDSVVMYNTGYAFGNFQNMLSEMDASELYETIPDFHNTKKRAADFFDSVDKDPLGRVKNIKDEIAFFEKYRADFSKLVDMLEAGILPLRVTHNDTKYNNILIDKNTGKPICVIDLDTVMPGLSTYDFGDAVRGAANTAAEDEKDLSKVGLALGFYEDFTKGFIIGAKSFLTENEVKYMALGAPTIAYELASRFLADYICGDKYFRIHRDNHNLDRARCQIRLAQDMLDKYDKMCNIVERYYK